MKCTQCGKEHTLLEPSFRRPDVVFALPPEERRRRVVRESNDVCVFEGGRRNAVVSALHPPNPCSRVSGRHCVGILGGGVGG